MPRGSRHRSHRQHHKQAVKDLADSDEGENTRYGPELLPEAKAEGKRPREEAKGDFSKEKHEIQKRKSQPQARELGPGNSSATYFPSKKKRGEAMEAAEAEASVVSPPPLSVDRWNGGEPQGDALSLLAYLHCSKDKDSKTDSESSDRNIGVIEDKEGGKIEEKSHRSTKGKPPDIDSGTSRASVIDGPDPFHANAKVSRNKGSRRRETQEDAASQGNPVKFAEELQASARVDSDALNPGKVSLAKSTAAKPGTRGRWDKAVARKDLKEPNEGASNCDVQRSSEREKRVRDLKPEKVVGVPPEAVSNFEGNKKQGSLNEGLQEKASDKEEQKNTEWQLQDELRNIELEKELENRIQRRREESGERERRRDDDRDEAKRIYRDDRHRDDRYKDEKQRDDRHRDDRYKDEMRKDDRYREEKYIDDSHRADKHHDDKHRERRLPREHAIDRYGSKHSREGSRAPEARHKESKHYDSDRDYSSHYDDRYMQHRNHRDQSRVSRNCEDLRETKVRGNKDFATEGDRRGTSMGHHDGNLDQERLSSALPFSEAGDGNDKQHKRVHAIGSNIDKEEQRLKVKKSESESKGTLFEVKHQRTRDERVARNLDQFRENSRDPGILRCKNRAERKLEGHGDESPLGSVRSSPYDGRTSPVLSRVECSPKTNGRLSPVNLSRKSPSSYIHDVGHPLPYEKVGGNNKFENGNDASSASGMRRQASRSWHHVDTSDRGKQQFGGDGISCKDPGGTCKSTDDHRIRSPSIERVQDAQMNSLTTDEFSRANSVHAAGCRVGGSQDSRWVSSGGPPASGERPSKGRRLEEMPSSRSDWTPHPVQMNRPMGSPIRPQVPLSARPSGLLPPPPPFRPGIDNPAILGPSSTGFEDVPYSRDQRRVDRQTSGLFKRGEVVGGAGQGDVWKGVGNWNSHGQGPGPSSMFLPFQHHIGAHPHAGFLNMGQQFTGPPMFGVGVRPSTEMGHSGVRYHMRESGDAFSGHNRTFGWQRQADDACGAHTPVALHAWDGPGSYAEEAHIYARPDRDQTMQGMASATSCNWDRATDMWKVNTREANLEFTQRESDYQGRYSTDESRGGSRGRHEKIRRERSPIVSIEIKRSEEVPAKGVTENRWSSLVSEVQKPSKNKHESMRCYLSRLDISAGLAGLDLYKQFADLLDLGETMSSTNDDVLKDMQTEASSDDFKLEVDADAESLVHSLQVQSVIFPSLPKEAFQRALGFYKKVNGGIKWDPVVDSSANLSMGQLDKVLVASECSNGERCCTTAYDKAVTDDHSVTVSGNASTCQEPTEPEKDVPSASEIPCYLQDVVPNEAEISQDAPHTGCVGDVNLKEPEDNVNSVASLEEVVDNVNAVGLSVELVNDVNAMVFSVEAADCVDAVCFSEELAVDHDAIALLAESAEVTDVTNILEKPVDAVNAVGSLYGLAVNVNSGSSTESDKALSEVKENNVVEVSETMPCEHLGDANCKGKEKIGSDHIATIDSSAPILQARKVGACSEHATAAEYVSGLEKQVREYQGEAESGSESVSQSCAFRESNDGEELDAVSNRCLDSNQSIQYLPGETATRQGESPESTDIAHKKALKFELVDSKISIENFSQYNLPGNTH